ncbi:M48 family metallopeptidase [cf. Phormidesmis sp. LEGE 11477]|uniref:M48 family metallopeptidase n=1 Tax=cf. Phormidesmis sp. LEGE 11477 TaxID=1828680 RepID=UPI0019F3C983|nr:M48 family metallopeptidase [cf. Phormidesmis sp. LEGE 11477]MBE9064745.1 M48 family metalloprotease [cf. Phormidesmis sp. LEGE 11477]
MLALFTTLLVVIVGTQLPATGKTSAVSSSAVVASAEAEVADNSEINDLEINDLKADEATEESVDLEGSVVEEEQSSEETAEDSSEAETEASVDAAEENVAGEEVAEEGTAEGSSPSVTAEERVRRKLLIQADREYAAGNFSAARALYQQAKNQTWLIPQQFRALPPEPFTDEAALRPGAAVYWREAKAGADNQTPAQTLTALGLLTEEYPAFIPGHLRYAIALQENDQPDAAADVLEAALTQYPGQSDLLLAQIDLFMAQAQWLEAAIASRQFVALNPDHESTEQQQQLAAENLQRFQRETRAEIREGAIANVFTGALGYALTGNIFGPFTAANSTILLLQGENTVGAQVSNQIRQRLPMLQNPEAIGYVRRIGNRLSKATGRRDLDYEFHIILDPNLNAFALPGGKIFVNAGAILDTQSEAELAGLLSHELAHAVLSHGFQIATRSNLSSSIAQYLPYGGLINNVFLSGYSRDMERQADIVGTQILAASDYAADGVYNVMVTLNEQAQASGRNVPTWISSHPNPEDRVTYLKTLVERGGYDRYAYEGVASHEEIQAVVARELAAYQAQQTAEHSPEEVVDDAVEERQQTDLYDAVDRFNW